MAPKAMGVTDNLPTRVAYQQLNTLAGMAGKVQEAILHNRSIFEGRIRLEEVGIMKKVRTAFRIRV